MHIWKKIDLCWRLRSRGYELVCLPQSVVYHVGGATLKKENPRKTFLNFRNNLLMLYKNLPAEELVSVMRTRTCLDYLAALFFLLKGDVSNFRAVLQARKEFLRLRPEFASARQENLDKTALADIPEHFKFSILWQSKLLGRKKICRFTCEIKKLFLLLRLDFSLLETSSYPLIDG